MVFGLTVAIYWSMKLSFIHVFSGSALGWISYLKAHELVTGQMIDKSVQIRGLETQISWLGIIGVVMMFTAFPTGVIAVNQQSFGLILAVDSLFLTGYMVGHYGFTDEIL